ncbi:MAG: hypothetical protein CMH13_11135 [Martelella sp.]|uniref:hypothetical protein n=1 Tax=Martelella sp. TaxID=1969699 RepID=UPI000C5F217D|nr:hypothetical protein [Martelella sp.]MAU21073.1 hypothetical protein [Martelella sp.]
MVPTLDEIEILRTRIGVDQKAMCERGDVSQSTLVRCRKAGREPTERVRRKLKAALDGIAEERGIVVLDDQGGR